MLRVRRHRVDVRSLGRCALYVGRAPEVLLSHRAGARWVVGQEDWRRPTDEVGYGKGSGPVAEAIGPAADEDGVLVLGQGANELPAMNEIDADVLVPTNAVDEGLVAMVISSRRRSAHTLTNEGKGFCRLSRVATYHLSFSLVDGFLLTPRPLEVPFYLDVVTFRLANLFFFGGQMLH